MLWAFYHIYPSVLSALDSPQRGAQAYTVATEEPSPSRLISCINNLRPEPAEVPGHLPVCSSPLSSPEPPLLLSAVLVTWGALRPENLLHFAGCSDKAEWDNPRMPRPHLEIFSQSALEQQCNKATVHPKADKGNRNRWERTLVNQEHRSLSLNSQEIARWYLSLVLKLVCGDFRHACCPQGSGKVAVGILANLPWNPQWSWRVFLRRT